MTTVGNVRATPTPEGIYIGRGSPFGNSYMIGRDGTREEVISKFEKDFHKKLREDNTFFRRVQALKNKNLLCFCKPKACHGDIIAGYLNDRRSK